jgi:serine/threonine protein kinase
LYRIKNEYVVQLIDHFEDVANGDIYLIMEHIEGEDLFKSIYDKKVQLEVSDIARVLYQICSALI